MKSAKKRAKRTIAQIILSRTAIEAEDERELIMTGNRPLEVPQRVGDSISQAVEDFARKRELDPHLWYHNESIWLVRSRSNDLYREVQIAAFSWDRKESLFFIPQAYAFEGGAVRAAKQTVVNGLIKSLPLSELEASDHSKIVQYVHNTLPAAWSNAESISEKDLEVIKEKK
jgi:hypothetical protein